LLEAAQEFRRQQGGVHANRCGGGRF
jgi:hypothetical protein